MDRDRIGKRVRGDLAADFKPLVGLYSISDISFQLGVHLWFIYFLNCNLKIYLKIEEINFKIYYTLDSEREVADFFNVSSSYGELVIRTIRKRNGIHFQGRRLRSSNSYISVFQIIIFKKC